MPSFILEQITLVGKGEIFITTVSIVVNNIIVSSLHMIKENIIFVVKNVNGNGKVKI